MFSFVVVNTDGKKLSANRALSSDNKRQAQKPLDTAPEKKTSTISTNPETNDDFAFEKQNVFWQLLYTHISF